MRPTKLGSGPIPPIALALIAGLFLFALAGRSHGPNSVTATTLRCPDFAAATAHHGRVRIERIRGGATTCAEVRRVLAAWFAVDLATGRLPGGFRCGIDPPQSVSLLGPTGGCKRSETAGVRFDMRFARQR